MKSGIERGLILKNVIAVGLLNFYYIHGIENLKIHKYIC